MGKDMISRNDGQDESDGDFGALDIQPGRNRKQHLRLWCNACGDPCKASKLWHVGGSGEKLNTRTRSASFEVALF